MKTGRPKIKVPLEGVDIILDILSATVLILLTAYTVISYSELPETIPSHFNAYGEADAYSNKRMIWLLPALSIVFFFGLYTLNKYPHIHNYMVNITEDNALKNYRFSTRVVRFTNLFVLVVFAFACFTIVQAAKNNTVELGSWFLPVVIGFSLVLPIVIIVYQKRINR